MGDSIHTIPLQPSTADYTFGVTIDGNHYFMHVYWNDRDAAWYFDMAASDETPIISGVKIVLGTLLGRTAAKPPFSTGVLGVYDNSGKMLDAGFDDLGSRVTMKWLPTTQFLARLDALRRARP